MLNVIYNDIKNLGAKRIGTEGSKNKKSHVLRWLHHLKGEKKLTTVATLGFKRPSQIISDDQLGPLTSGIKFIL